MGWIIGVDEVGRGSLAGDVCAGAVMGNEETLVKLANVRDSKELSPRQREGVFGELRACEERHGSLHWAVAFRSVETINRTGIDRAVLECFKEAVDRLLSAGWGPVVEVRIDGRKPAHPFGLAVPVRFIVDGDALDWHIGAASIVAKVTRDARMAELAKTHPGYGWERNAGYGTKEHIAAIKAHGLTPLHRLKFCRNFVPALKEDPGIESVLDMFR